MSRSISANARSLLIKLASSLPVGSPERKAILAGLGKGWDGVKLSNSSAERVVMMQTAAPLDDYYSIHHHRGLPSRTVGHGREKDPTFMEAATSYFKARSDSWALVFLNEDNFLSKGVEEYVASNPKLRNSKIIVVRTKAMPGDYSTADWVILHDIIGHGIAYDYPELNLEISEFVHHALPDKYRVNKNGRPDDRWPDICAAVFFQVDVDKLISEATEIAEVLFDAHGMQPEIAKTLRELSDYVRKWEGRFQPGKPVVLKLWGD